MPPKKRKDSLRAVARALKVTIQAAQKARDSGRITPEPDGTWNVAKARRQWRANTAHAKRHTRDPEPNGRQPDAEESLGAGWNRARTVETTLRARILELRLRKEMGEVLDGEEWRRVAKAQAKATADKLMSVPSIVGPELLGITDLAEMISKLEEAMGKICDELASYPPAQNGNGPAEE